MRKSNGDVYILMGAVVLVGLAFVAIVGMRGSTIVVQKDSPVTFGSVRKHPFDVFADPYHPPARENPYLDRNYNQVGVLKDGKGSGMLPLFGRPTPYSNSKWEYYTMNGNLKLPVAFKGRPCDSDTGCEELLDGNTDRVNVMGLGPFESFVYGTKQLAYNPKSF
jgi:hypothetical protein